MTKYFGTPFASSGDKTAVPDALQPGGEVSYTEGWTADYEADQTTDPNAKDVDRQAENQLKFDITEALKEIQERGFKVYDAVVVYPVNSYTVGSDGDIYKSLIENGPSTGAGVVDPVGDVSGTWVDFESTIETTPTGQVSSFASSTVPSGWLECDGSAISRTTYSDLFSIIGTLYGVGDGATTFNIPDLRGEFVRGWDNGAGIDMGRAIGSSQNFSIENITGQINISAPARFGTMSGAFQAQGTVNQVGSLGGGSGNLTADFDASRVVSAGTETRPRNTAMMYCIKF